MEQQSFTLSTAPSAPNSFRTIKFICHLDCVRTIWMRNTSSMRAFIRFAHSHLFYRTKWNSARDDSQVCSGRRTILIIHRWYFNLPMQTWDERWGWKWITIRNSDGYYIDEFNLHVEPSLRIRFAQYLHKHNIFLAIITVRARCPCQLHHHQRHTVPSSSSDCARTKASANTDTFARIHTRRTHRNDRVFMVCAK